MTKEEVIDLYVRRHGKQKAMELLNFLGKEQHFMDAISTETGREVMSLLINRADDSFNRFRSLLPDNEDIGKLNTKTIIALAEYNVCVKIINEVQSRINAFNKHKIG